MILVDTSVWVDHLRKGDEALIRLLGAGLVLTHPFVVGELALGSLRQREVVLTSLLDLPRADVATDTEVLHFIDQHDLAGSGIGYVDAHLLAAATLTGDTQIWTNDRRLGDVAARLDLTAAIS